MTTTSRTLALPLACLACLACLAFVLGAASASAEDTAESGSRDPQAALAPVGDCAKPRVLARPSEPDRFPVAGPPAARFAPAQVAASMPIPNASPVPDPAPPANPTASLCDSPAGCSSARPAIVEDPTVPSGLPGQRP